MNGFTAYLIELSVLLLLVSCGCLVYGSRGRGRPRVTEEERAEAARVKREMEEMLSTPGWKRMVAIAEAQTKARSNEVLLKATDNPYVQEYMKGEVNGIRSFLQIPLTVVEESKRIIELANQEEGIE